MRYVHVAALLAAVAWGGGCVTYQREPLLQAALIASLDDQRATPMPGDGTLTFAMAAAWMSTRHPDLQELQADYDRLAAVADIPSPWPNPGVEAGLARAFRLDAADAGRTQPFVGMGFAIPLGPRLQATDDLNRATAEAARVTLVGRHRELYVELSHAFARYAMATERLQAQRDMLRYAEDVLAIMQKLAEQGAATALDAGLARLELGRLQLESSAFEAEVDTARAELALLTGVSVMQLSGLQPVPGAVGILWRPDDLPLLLADNQPELARLAAAYEVAERRLRLEIARQYPDLELGWEAEQEPGERTRTLGLSIGIEVPLFDRNQVGIAEAQAARRQARTAYTAAAARILAQIDTLYARDARLAERQRIVRDELRPQAEANVSDARRLIQAGRMAAIQFVELERGARELRVAELDLDLQRRALTLELERLLGLPLVTQPAVLASLPGWAAPTKTDSHGEPAR